MMKRQAWLLFLGAWIAVSGSVAASEWEVRRLLSPDQKPEWTTAGYLPKWTVNTAPDGTEITIDGDETRKFRGTVLVGREIQLPDPMPPGLRVSLQFTSSCSQDSPPRSGVPCLAFYTPAVWQSLDTSDPPTMVFDAKLPDQQPLIYQAIAGHGEDVLEWRDWQSDELARRLRDHAGKSLILAVVWSAHHFHAEEKAAFRNVEIVMQSQDDIQREFFSSLDLSRTDLATVREAVENEDWPTAGAALADYYRHRTTPPPHPLSKTTSREYADRICDHVFTFVGCEPYQLPRDIQWNEDPFDYDQWAIALNRHTHWRNLGATYAGTGDEKYAREFVSQLRSWIDAMPVLIGQRYVQGPYSVAGRSPLSLDAGIRMGQTWFPAFYYFLQSPSFGDEDLLAMLQSFRRHAEYLMNPRHFRPGSNWGAMESNGLLHIGCYLPEFRDADKWRETAIARLYAELDHQVYPDGAQKELTPGYHGVTLGNVLDAVRVAEHCQVALPDDFIAKLERMFDYYVRIRKPDGTTPMLNDSWNHSDRGQLAKGVSLFPNREDFAFFATGGRSGKLPDYTSTRLDYAGWHMMRSGWDKDACYMVFDGGPFGTGHQHEDKLSIVVHAFGRTVIPEAGRYSYDASKWYYYALSTPSHNTIMVDGLPQRHRAVRASWESKEPVDTVWHTSEVLDYAASKYTLGYGRDENVPVEHHRDVVFLKPRLWLVVDRLKANDEKCHTYESLFHLNADAAVADAETGVVVTSNPTGANVALVPIELGDWHLDIVTGQEEPTVQGWLMTNKHNVLRPVPTAVYRCEKAGGAQIAYLIAPLRQGEAMPVVEPIPTTGDAKDSGLAFRVTLPDESSHTVLWNGTPGTPIEAGMMQTSARAAMFTADGELLAEVP